LITFDGEKATRRDVTVYLKDNFWILLDGILGLSLYLCIIGIIINLIIRKKTLMYKQILLTLPILLIPAIIVAINLYLSVQEQNTRRTEIEIEQVCRIATAAFEDYDFSDLDELDADAGVASAKLHEKLAGFNTENGDYIYSIIARTDDTKATVLARSDTLIMPYYDLQDFYKGKEVADSAGNVEYFLFEDVSALLSQESKSSSVYAYGWIHDSKDTGRYYLKVETDSWSFFTVRRDTFLKILFYIVGIAVVLTLITILTSLYVSKAIKRVTKTVKQIAGGDFSARIKYRSKDELGEICGSVNNMAGNLENVFDEKDKTEKFYYKFVPEKFRELLGKEQFTDLALGDAKSLDLTVLFFDIRGFSINSEMMTAKENFEFVNIVYGKAGPIIRKYNGFVDKYIGDAVMALFEKSEDAVNCGIELYREIVLNENTAKEIGVGDINIGIGIHSGMARIGIVGESERLSGTVISDTVNLSSRLESLTKQYKTAMLISKDTVDRMADPDSMNMRYLGEVQVAGVNEVKAIYEVLDCLGEEKKEKRSKNLDEFKEAVRLFHLGRRDEAAATLKDIEDKGNADEVTSLYYNYISNMSDEDKGNVFRFVRK
jgi:class 3 adenylate cyclase/HAMP domain-containing protein